MSRRKACDYPGCEAPWRREYAAFGVKLCVEHEEEYADFVFLPHRSSGDYEKICRIELDFMVLCGSATAARERKQLLKNPGAYVKRRHPYGLYTAPWKEWRIDDLPAHVADLCRRVFGLGEQADEQPQVDECDEKVAVEPAREEDETSGEFVDDLPPIDWKSLDNDAII